MLCGFGNRWLKESTSNGFSFLCDVRARSSTECEVETERHLVGSRIREFNVANDQPDVTG